MHASLLNSCVKCRLRYTRRVNFPKFMHETGSELPSEHRLHSESVSSYIKGLIDCCASSFKEMRKSV